MIIKSLIPGTLRHARNQGRKGVPRCPYSAVTRESNQPRWSELLRSQGH